MYKKNKRRKKLIIIESLGLVGLLGLFGLISFLFDFKIINYSSINGLNIAVGGMKWVGSILLLAFSGIFIFATYFSKFQEKVAGHKSSIDSLELKSDRMYNLLLGMAGKSLIKANSPIDLTEKGKETLDKLELNKILDNHFEEFKKIIFAVEPKPTNEYHIQEVSINKSKNIFFGMLSKEEKEKIEKEAYLQGIIVEDIMGIIGVLIRNKLFVELGLKEENIDKNDPTKKQSN